MEMKPKITLLISTYNWESALSRVLEGVSKQTVLPDEVVIADDGSRPETAKLIENIKSHFPVPILHVWHEDKGFRKTIILNKAIASSTGDYIIQIDGDTVPEKHFIQDHIEILHEGNFVCGSRVLLLPNGSVQKTHYVNLVRSSILRRLYSAYPFKFSEKHVRGCNLAFWKKDFLAVNGYNEDITGWGHEDRELVYRLLFSGIKERRLKFGGVNKHIYHDHSVPLLNRKKQNYKIQCDTVKSHSNWCENGVSKYL